MVDKKKSEYIRIAAMAEEDMRFVALKELETKIALLKKFGSKWEE